MLYALTMWLDFFYWEAEVLPGYELFAFKIDCIYLIFLQVFDISCFDLAGSIEFPEPLLDLPQIPNLKGLCVRWHDEDWWWWSPTFSYGSSPPPAQYSQSTKHALHAYDASEWETVQIN